MFLIVAVLFQGMAYFSYFRSSSKNPHHVEKKNNRETDQIYADWSLLVTPLYPVSDQQGVRLLQLKKPIYSMYSSIQECKPKDDFHFSKVKMAL